MSINSSNKNKIKYHTESKSLKLDDIKKNDWNPNFVSTEMMQAIKDDIQQNGFIGNIVVQKQHSSGMQNVIINGEHRYEAVKQLGGKTIPAIVLDIDDTHAMALTLRLNREHGELMPDKVLDLLHLIDQSYDLENLKSLTAISERELQVIGNLNILEKNKNDESLTQLVHKSELELQKPIEKEKGQRIHAIKLTWAAVETLSRRLARSIQDRFEADNIDIMRIRAIVAISKGGIIPARLICRELNINRIVLLPFKDRKPESVAWNIKEDETDEGTPPFIVIDDIADTYETYHVVKDIMKEEMAVFGRFIAKEIEDIDNEKERIAYGHLDTSKQWIIFPWESGIEPKGQ